MKSVITYDGFCKETCRLFVTNKFGEQTIRFHPVKTTWKQSELSLLDVYTKDAKDIYSTKMTYIYYKWILMSVFIDCWSKSGNMFFSAAMLSWRSWVKCFFSVLFLVFVLLCFKWSFRFLLVYEAIVIGLGQISSFLFLSKTTQKVDNDIFIVTIHCNCRLKRTSEVTPTGFYKKKSLNVVRKVSSELCLG